jgi:hypothetical protein
VYRHRRCGVGGVLTGCLVALLVVTACETKPTPSGTSPPVTPGALGSLEPASDSAIAAYGYAPIRSSPVTYQPDVVLVEAGAAAILGLSDDTLTWTLDRRAPGVNDLAVDKVLFATSEAVGRVVAMHDEGDSRIVTLAPVDLTEVIRDGEINVDTPIDLNAFDLQPIVDYPGVSSEPRPGDPTPPAVGYLGEQRGGGVYDIAVPAMQLVPRTSTARLIEAASAPATAGPSPSASTGPSLPPNVEAAKCLEAKVGNWITKPCVQEGKFSVEINHQIGKGLKLGAVFTLRTENLRVRTHAAVSGGVIDGTEAVIEGITGVDLSLIGGVEDPSDNDKLRMEVPIEISFPIPPGVSGLPIPIMVRVEVESVVETAFSGRNSTSQTTAAYQLLGPIGYRNGEFLSPSFTVKSGLLDNVGGLPVGVSGMVVSIKTKFQAGLGGAIAMAGPYIAIQVAVGITQGSALGASLARCRGATLTLKGTVGFGVLLEVEELQELTKRLAGKAGFKLEVEKSWDLIEPRSEVVPKVPLCLAG